MLSVPSNTSIAPSPSTEICMIFSSPWVSTLASAEMRPTVARRWTPCATLSSQALIRTGSSAIDFTVRMPWMVSTRWACRLPSAA